MRISYTHKYILDILENKYQVYLEKQGQKKLKANKELWQVLSKYIKDSSSVGASYSDYWLLYQYIRQARPKEVLECGTGVTTIVMAYAMLENEKEHGIKGRITSMEEMKKYYRIACDILPNNLKKYVEIIYSPGVEDFHAFFRGMRYRDVPDRPYDFVYVDGPGTSTPDGEKTFDFDFIHVVLRSKKPVFAIVDTRMSTCWAFQNVFKNGKVIYDYGHNIGLIGPYTKNDILFTNDIIKKIGPHPVKRRRIINKSIQNFFKNNSY